MKPSTCCLLLAAIFSLLILTTNAQTFHYSRSWLPSGKRARLPVPSSANCAVRSEVAKQLMDITLSIVEEQKRLCSGHEELLNYEKSDNS